MKNMRKTKEQVFKQFLNLENYLVENQRQIMYIVQNMRLINDKIRNLKNKTETFEFLIHPLIVSGPEL